MVTEHRVELYLKQVKGPESVERQKFLVKQILQMCGTDTIEQQKQRIQKLLDTFETDTVEQQKLRIQKMLETCETERFHHYKVPQHKAGNQDLYYFEVVCRTQLELSKVINLAKQIKDIADIVDTSSNQVYNGCSMSQNNWWT